MKGFRDTSTVSCREKETKLTQKTGGSKDPPAASSAPRAQPTRDAGRREAGRPVARFFFFVPPVERLAGVAALVAGVCLRAANLVAVRLRDAFFFAFFAMVIPLPQVMFTRELQTPCLASNLLPQKRLNRNDWEGR
jgi:hypothetical protein